MIIDASWNRAYDIVLLDRGIFDCCCWMEYLHQHGLVTGGEANILNLFYLLPFFTQKIDCALIVVCDPDVALQRVHAIQISNTKGFTNSHSLKNLHEQSCKLYQRYHQIYPQLKFLDTTLLTPQKMAQRAADIILSALSCNTRNNILQPPMHAN